MSATAFQSLLSTMFTVILLCQPAFAQESQVSRTGNDISRELDRLKALSESELAEKGMDIARSIQLTLGKKRELARIQSRVDAETTTLSQISKLLEKDDKAYRENLSEIQELQQQGSNIDLSQEIALLRAQKSRIVTLQGYVQAIESRLREDTNKKNLIIAQVNSPSKSLIADLPVVPAEMLQESVTEGASMRTSESDMNWLDREYQAIHGKGGN